MPENEYTVPSLLIFHFNHCFLLLSDAIPWMSSQDIMNFRASCAFWILISISDPTYLLPAKRDAELISRFAIELIFPTVRARTSRFRISFIHSTPRAGQFSGQCRHCYISGPRPRLHTLGKVRTLDIAPLRIANHHRRSAQVWRVFSTDFTVLPAYPHAHPQSEWVIPAFAFPAAAGTHLPTPEGWKAE